MFAMPHHMDLLQHPTIEDIGFKTIRGNVTGVAGNVWTLAYGLSTISWDAPRNYTKDTWAAEVKNALMNDVNFTATSRSSRNFGKQVNKMARLALIADSLEEAAAATEIRGNMKAALEPWMNGTYLRYDETWGGIFDGISLNETSTFMSNAHYFNQLHDFGYQVYALAAIIRKDMQYYSKYRS